MKDLFYTPDRIELERKRRIKLCVAAYAYEVVGVSIMTDAYFDSECLKVNLDINTGNRVMDEWFRENFDPSTGQWIHQHPDLEGIERLYKRHYCGRIRCI